MCEYGAYCYMHPVLAPCMRGSNEPVRMCMFENVFLCYVRIQVVIGVRESCCRRRPS